MENEIWRPIPGYEGLFEVSNMGRLKSIKFTNDRIFKQVSKSKYRTASLRKNNRMKSIRVHRLVALVFVENPNNKPEVNHKNGITTDNRAENLEWVTKSENQKHAYRVLGRIKNFKPKNI